MYFKYIGLKATKEDNVAGTKLIWARGEVIEVPAGTEGKFLAHPHVWAPTDASGALLGQQPALQVPGEPAPRTRFKQPLEDEPYIIVDVDAPDQAIDLEQLETLTAMRQFAADNGLEIPMTNKGSTLRALREACLRAVAAEPAAPAA